MSAILAIIGIIATTLLGGSNPFAGNVNQQNSSANTINDAKFACKPTIDTSRVIKATVRPGLEGVYKNNIAHPEFNRENDEWVLIKTDAPIPAWKAYINPKGTRGGETFAEMEHLGTVDALGSSGNPDDGKEVFIGIGWCNPETAAPFTGDPNFTPRPDSCLDPLVQDVLFVPTRKGIATTDLSSFEQVQCDGGTRPWVLCFDWGGGTASEEFYQKYPRSQENLDKYYWNFNVYYKTSKLPATPTVEDLPCWIRKLADNCPNAENIFGDHRMDARNIPGCEQTVLGTSDPAKPGLTFAKSDITLTQPLPSGITLADIYISLQKTDTPPTDPIIGTALANHFDARIRVGDIAGTDADHAIILDPRRNGHDGPYWIYVPLLETSQPNGANTLQLGSFTPGIPSFFYEWWTPACKPAIYLYPEKKTALTVSVNPIGFITQSIPPYPENGWNVIARPDGSIYSTDTNTLTLYPYLYYEAAIKQIRVPRTTGWIRTREDLPSFFASILPKLGLNKKEQQDFTDYWVPKLAEGNKWFITLVDREELDRIEPITFSIKPDIFIRIRFYFEKLDDNNINNFSLSAKYEIPNTNYKRNGFTAVDWGGIIANGSCGVGEVSN